MHREISLREYRLYILQKSILNLANMKFVVYVFIVATVAVNVQTKAVPDANLQRFESVLILLISLFVAYIDIVFYSDWLFCQLVYL